MKSLRARLILGCTAGMVVVLLAAAGLVYVLVRAHLVEQLDASLLDEARLLTSAVEVDSEEIELEFDDLDLSSYQAPAGPGFLQLWRSGGAVVHRSPSLGEADLDRSQSPPADPAFGWLTLPNGQTARAVEMTFQPRHDEAKSEYAGRDECARGRERAQSLPASAPTAIPLILILARDAAPVREALGSLGTILIVVGIAAVVLTAGGMTVLIRRGLGPLNQVGEAIGSLDEENLSQRLAAGNAPDELRPVVDRLNGLLGRLETAFGRERGFSADVAHELRTPLAGLRSTLDVGLSKARPAGDYEEMMADCRQIVLQMQAMVENLLTLARLETGQADIDPRPVSIERVAADEWAPLQEQAQRRKLQVQWQNGPDGTAVTDPTLLALAVRNILANAVTHADEGGSIRIETGVEDESIRLHVVNSGSAVPAEKTEMVFERFWRGDDARARTGIHCGLGLPLVQRAAAALGGSVQAHSTQPGPFQITLRVPSLRS